MDHGVVENGLAHRPTNAKHASGWRRPFTLQHAIDTLSACCRHAFAMLIDMDQERPADSQLRTGSDAMTIAPMHCPLLMVPTWPLWR